MNVLSYRSVVLFLLLIANASTNALAKDYKWSLWSTEEGSYKIPYSDARVRLIALKYQGPPSKTRMKAAFLEAAKECESRNVTYSFNRQFRNGEVTPDNNPTTKIIAGWYNYTNRQYSYCVIRSVGDVNGSGFRYTLDDGSQHRVNGDAWKVVWRRLADWELDWVGGYYNIGIQMGHDRGNTGRILIGFRLDKVSTSSSP